MTREFQHRRDIIRAGIGGAALAAMRLAVAQGYPSRPVRLVVGFPPGGSNDAVARQIAPKIAEALGTQIVVENRPGANAIIGTEYVAKAPPDGYTLTLSSTGPLAINPATYSKLPYDTIKDFEPITSVARTYSVIAVSPSVPARNINELIALAKAQPGKLNFALSGIGGQPQLVVELFKSIAGVKIVEVPYKGGGPALADVLGGHVQAIVADFPVLYPHIKSGKLNGLAITSAKRNPLLPDLPTAVEQGVNLEAFNWFAIMAPARTPAPVIDKLFAAITKAVNDPDVKTRLLNEGIDVWTTKSPGEFSSFLKTELVRWNRVATESGVHAD